MKTFKEFINECYSLIYESPKPPDYNYEESFVRIFNYLTGSEDRKNSLGKQVRGLIQRSAGDSSKAADAMNDIVSIIAKELTQAETDTNHPLHFDNAPDGGFTKGKRTEEHRQAYYEKLNNQKYTFLNFIGSESGRRVGAKGLLAVRAGNEKIQLSPRGVEVYGKPSDTSKADVLFKDNSGETLHTSSLKDVQGSVYASAGPEETKGNLLMAMYASLDERLKKNEIDENEYSELERRGKELASQISLKMTTKGLSKEEEKKIINPDIDTRGLFRTMGEFENSFPGVSDYLAKEQITGKGKYGQGVDSVLKTGRGGGLIEFPEFLSAYTKQRFRTSKHGEKGNVSTAADALNIDSDADRPEPSPESRNKLTQTALDRKISQFEPEIQNEIEKLRASGKLDIRDLADYEEQDIRVKELKSKESQAQPRPQQTGKLKTLDQFQQDAQAAQAQHAQTASELEKQTVQTAKDLEAAKASAADAAIIRRDDGTEVPRKNAFYLQNNPDAARQHADKKAAATQSVQTAQDAHDTAVTTHQTHLSTPPAPPTPEQPPAPQPAAATPTVATPATPAPPTPPTPATPAAPTPQENPNEKKKQEMRDKMAVAQK